MLPAQAAVALASLTIASPILPPLDHHGTDLETRQQKQEPCKRISDLAAQGVEFFSPDTMLACLNSVPLQKEEAHQQIKGLRSMLQFQSTLEYLKYPPPGYMYEGVDLLGGLDGIEKRLDEPNPFNNSEYQFSMAIFDVFQKAHEGHLGYRSDIMAVASFVRMDGNSLDGPGKSNPLSLVSISSNGTSRPDVFAYSDLAALQNQNATGFRPSAIRRIQGQEVNAMLLSYVDHISGLQDPDANYNTLFRDATGISEGPGEGFFAILNTFQGNDTTVEFANGTQRTYLNAARLALNLTLEGVHDGKSFLDKIQQPIIGSRKPTTITRVPAKVRFVPLKVTSSLSPRHASYPSPIAVLKNGDLSGYFPGSHKDLAVLVVGIFMVGGLKDAILFENMVRQFLATAKEHKKTKLILDLRSNNGGVANLVYDMFRELFPSLIPYDAGTYREHTTLEFIERTLSNSLVSSAPRAKPLGTFNVIEEQNATSDSLEGLLRTAHVYHGGNYSTVFRFDLAELAADSGVPIYGYNADTEPQPQVFQAADMLLLHDGICSSACASLTELLKSQAGVRSVVVGGRPKDGPMQGVGGTKGTLMQSLHDLRESATKARMTNKKVPREVNDLLEGGQVLLKRSINQANFPSVNFRNDIREGDESMTPLQFVYEAADCRFFYTAEMFEKQENVWNRAYQWAWMGRDVCVPGSTGHKSAQRGLEYILDPPPAGTLPGSL